MHPDKIELIREHMEWDEEASSVDSLAVYTSHDLNNGLYATYSDARWMPDRVTFTGSEEVVLVLSADTPATSFLIRYETTPGGYKLGPFNLGPDGFFWAVLALFLVSLSLFWWAIYIACLVVANAGHRQAVQRTPLGYHADVEELAMAAAARDKQNMIALQALPTRRWRQAGPPDSEDWKADDCCLCLDKFQDNDEVRMLPCLHYFHRECVDTWFQSRRFNSWTCPKCRRNPLALRAGTEGAQPGSEATGRPAALQSNVHGEGRSQAEAAGNEGGEAADAGRATPQSALGPPLRLRLRDASSSGGSSAASSPRSGGRASSRIVPSDDEAAGGARVGLSARALPRADAPTRGRTDFCTRGVHTPSPDSAPREARSGSHGASGRASSPRGGRAARPLGAGLGRGVVPLEPCAGASGAPWREATASVYGRSLRPASAGHRRAQPAAALAEDAGTRRCSQERCCTLPGSLEEAAPSAEECQPDDASRPVSQPTSRAVTSTPRTEAWR